MKKKVIAAVLTLGMVLGLLTGCAETGEEASDSPADTASSAEMTSGGEETEEPVETVSDDVKTIDLYIDFPWYASDNWEGIIPEEITQNTGVSFNVTRSVDDSQLGLMIASGELPDVVFTYNYLDRLCDSKLCYSYNELIDEYGLDWQPADERISIARHHNSDPSDENYYTIVQNYNTKEEWADFTSAVPSVAGIYYRKDIWEELGSPEMNTIAQIKDVMAMVHEKYPDIQVLNAGSPGWRLTGIGTWYGIWQGYNYDENGNVALMDCMPEFHDYMKCVNEFYRAGYFSEENLAITTEDDAYQQAFNGECFMFELVARPTQLDYLNSGLQANHPEAEFAYLPLPDDWAGIPSTNSGWAGMFISKNCKDPEAAIKIISYLNSEEGRHLSMWGREGIDYTLDDYGIPQFSEEWKEANKDTSVMAAKYNTNLFCTTEIDELCQYYSGRSDEEIEAFSKNTDKIESHPELSLAQPTATSDAGLIATKINEAKDAEKVKMYTAASDEEFEEAYNDYMELLQKLGVEDLNDYMNESVKQVREEFGFD